MSQTQGQYSRPHSAPFASKCHMVRPLKSAVLGGGPALAQAASLPQLGFSWQEIKVTTVFHNGSRQCETCVFTSSPQGDLMCQDRSAMQTQTGKKGFRRNASMESRCFGSKDRKVPSRPSSSPAGRQKSQSRPSSVPIGKQGKQMQKRYLQESVHVDDPRLHAQQPPDLQSQQHQQLPPQQQLDDPGDSRDQLHGKSSHNTQLSTAVISFSQATCTPSAEQSLGQMPNHHRSKGSKAPPDVWDDLVYLGMVQRLPPRKDPKSWPTHLWPKMHLGLSKHALLYQIDAGREAKRLCELITGREPGQVRRLTFPAESIQRFAMEIQPVEGETFVIACDEKGFLDDWLREINLLLAPYREPLGMSGSPEIAENAPKSEFLIPAQLEAQSAALENQVAETESVKDATLPESRIGTAANEHRLVPPSTVGPSKASSKESSTSQLPNMEKKHQGGPEGKGLGAGKDNLSTKANQVLKAITVVRNVQNMRRLQVQRVSVKSTVSDEDNEKDTVKMNELPRIAQTHGIPLKDLQETWKEFQVFSQGRNEIPRANFGAYLSVYLKVPEKQIPYHLMLHGVPRHRQSVLNKLGETFSFEEFVLWHKAHEFDPFVCQNQEARLLQALANENNLLLPDVEVIKKQYDYFDTDGSGRIEYSEFVSVICALLEVKDKDDLPPDRVVRYWGQLAGNGSSVGFQEFLPWYAQNFYTQKGGCAISQFYSSFGVNRFKK
eukprot:gnl/MRDRNA2_/MRDRNA2_89965_c0_seq1.p1 gnl/MRDRNA2_/MRDRNA2_89965_c0~~gnl/MRDRNA2_/MRDRNA2_89965_c0_seq1.p1  ORF type:complete len:720 (+),score=126.58 gnl/MRDRNA2_/MRDRNA2_89965_c0_seq1:232-2391(+)